MIPPRFNEGGAANGGAPRRGGQNRWFGGGQQAQQPMDEEAARRYRQRVFQMGLVVCLVLLFIDQKNSKDPYPPSPSDKGPDTIGKTDEEIARDGGIPFAKTQMLNSFLSQQPSDGYLYPKNATGYFRGSWTRLADLVLPEGHNHTASDTSGPRVLLNHNDGRFDMQLYMNSVRDVEGLSLLYGYFKLFDGPHASDQDIYSVAKGVYLHKTGRLLLRTMTQSDANSIAFTFILPEGAPGAASNTTEPAAKPPDHVPTASRQLRAVFNSQHHAVVQELARPFPGDRKKGRWVTVGRALEVAPPGASTPAAIDLPTWEREILKEDPSNAITSVDPNEAGALGVPSDGQEATVLIPNRSRNQYIRQTTTNGRKCIFQLDATSGPRQSQEPPASDAPVPEPDKDAATQAAANMPDKLKWVDEIQGVLYSPNCLVALNVTSEAMRLDWGKAYRKAVNYSIVVTLVCVLQIALLFRQLYYSRTQAAASRVSLLTIGQQAILDALLCIAHLLLCAMLQPLFAAFASIAFFKLVIFSIFEIRYMFIIHQSRNSQSVNATNFNGLRRQLATLHARFYAILFFILFLVYFLSSYLEVIIFLLYSFWVPQIVVNAVKGTRQPLNRTYVVGMSATRLIIPLYVYGCPENFVHLLFSDYKPDYRMCVLLVMWVSSQVVALLSQDIFGPQYMIPSRFLPPKYNYYRPLPQSLRRTSSDAASDDPEIELTAAMSDVENANLPECVICYNNIDTHTGIGYMIAPCDHLFHRECLERWMEIRLACPTCRQDLPAV